MILHVTVDVKLDDIVDPANFITKVTETLASSLRSVDGATTFQITQVLPSEEEPPVEAGDAPISPPEEETLEDV